MSSFMTEWWKRNYLYQLTQFDSILLLSRSLDKLCPKRALNMAWKFMAGNMKVQYQGHRKVWNFASNLRNLIGLECFLRVFDKGMFVFRPFPFWGQFSPESISTKGYRVFHNLQGVSYVFGRFYEAVLRSLGDLIFFFSFPVKISCKYL